MGNRVAARSNKKRPRAAYFAVYDLQGTSIPQELQRKLEDEILEVIEDYPTMAITVKAE